MASTNPAQYYEGEENHGNYQFESLDRMVDNFMDNYTGDTKIIGKVKRHNVLYWMKKGLQQFSFNALKEIKAVELELGDQLDIIMPSDYITYCRISWLDEKTGEFRPMAENRNIALATAYLQDHEAFILFDDNGLVLEGTSATQIINDGLTNQRNLAPDCYCGDSQKWSMDTSKNYNGTFNIDKRAGRIHFSSENATKIIILEYISDGLEYSSESDIKIHKFAEISLYDWTYWNILTKTIGVNQYDKSIAKKAYDTSYRNSKIQLMNLRVAETTQMLKQRNRWIR